MSNHRKGMAMQLRFLSVVTAMLEAGTGLALGLSPSMPVVIRVARFLRRGSRGSCCRSRTLLPWCSLHGSPS
ncbi:MAG: hypothetical protein H0W49_04790 [Nitrospirales bacterium]|nr:hypothetical protein [Nitrospirales bacterium]MBA3965636.1 hypothetical protein [Nitrospirales bacterium]